MTEKLTLKKLSGELETLRAQVLDLEQQLERKLESTLEKAAARLKTRIETRETGAHGAGIDAEQHQQMIAEVAYLIAESRGFQGGDPSRDWAEAEAEVRAHRAKIEEIEGRAEADRARARAEEARAAAADQRRRRRQVLALGAGILLAVVVAGGGWLWLSLGRAARARRASGSVEQVMREAGRQQGRGDLEAALVAAERACELARTEGVSPVARRRRGAGN